MKLHLPVLLRKAVLACFSVAFAYSMSSGSTAAADLTLGGDDSLAVDCADPSSITDLAGGTLTLAGGTELRISNCGTGDGKTYTLLTSVSGLLDDEGNVISLDSSNNAIANYFDTTQPGTGFWADAILVLTDDDTLQLVRYSEPVKDVLTITSRKTTGVTYLYYTGVKASGISSSYDGGAIYGGTSGTITLNNNGSVTFSNNVVRSKNGGVIYGNNTITLSNNGNVTSSNNSASLGGVIFGNNTITLSNNGSVKFSGNVATSYGGAIYGNNTITLSNNGSVEFDGNKTTATSGGGAAIYGGTVTLSNNELVRFSSNQSIYGSVNYGYTSYGGAIYGERIELSNNGSVLFNKNTASCGGAIYGDQSVLLNGNGNIEFTETSTGGAIVGQSVILSNNGNIKFESSTSTTSTYEHAIWYHTHSTAEIALRNNNFVSFIGFSSAIHVKGNINVSENVEISFAQNSAQHGGAIYNIAEKGIVEFSKNHDILFSENTAWKGGAIYHIGDIDFFENTGIISFASNGSIPGYTSSGTSESAFGGAIYAGGVLSFTDNQEIVFESNKSDLSAGYYEYDSAGGATYSTEANFINNSKVVFSNNSNIRRNSSYENDSYGGAVYVSNNLLFDNNDKVSFSGNYTEGDARGGAIYAGTEVQFINNGIIIFENNRTISGTDDSYNHGGAIYTKKIDLVNNQKISFKGNYEKNAAGNYRLRSLYIGNTSATTHDGSALFSSAYSDGVEFFDPFYINGDLRLNEKYTTADHVEIPQIGDIVISALYTDDALYYAKGNIDGSATELMNSKTSEVIGVTHLYDGRLRVEDGAIFEAKGGIQLHSSVTGKSTPTLYLRNSSLRGSTLLLEQGTLLELTGKNTATFTTFQLDDSGSVTFHMNEENADFAVLRLSGAFEQQGALTLNISFNDSEAEAGLYKLLTVTSIADDSLWTTSNVTVNGLDGYVVSFDDLEWKDNTLYLNYNGTPGTSGVTTPILLIATWTNEAQDGLWNGTSLNWEQEEVDYAYKDGVQVVFGDEGAGTVTLVGNIAPSSVLVDSKEDYTWNADSTAGGKLTGSMSLTKKGTGTLIINTENDYTGGTTIQGGTVVAGTATALGIGTVSLTDATLKIAAEGVENALTTAGTSSILVQDGGSLALQSAITNAATGILTLSGKVDVSGIGELTKLDATLIDVNGNAGTSGFARTEGYTLQVVQGGKVLASDAQLEHRGLPSGLTLVLGENGMVTAGATTDFTKYAVTGSHAVSVSEILKDVPQDSALSSIEMSGGTLLVDAATDALAATGGTVTVNKAVTLGGTMSGGMLMVQAGEIAATLSGSTSVVTSGAVTLSGANNHSGGVILNGGVLTLKHANALGSGQLVTSGTGGLVIGAGVELALGQAISNSGRLSISGSIDASGLALHSSAATRVDVNGVSGTSGFAKEAEQWVQIVNGGTTENKGVTILHSGTSDDLLLGADGRATYGGAIYHDEYLLTAGGAAGVREILNAGGAELIKITMEGGTLKVNADTSALLTATDGTILLVEGGTLGSGSSVSGVDIKASGGSIAATLTGSNTLEGIAGFALSSTITNTGTLTISGSINADALTLTKGSETHIDVNGESGASGFLKTAVESVQLTSGAGSTIDGGVTITHKDATGSLVLGKDGVATRGGEIDYTHYLLNGETASAKVSDIIADAGDALTGITVQQGTLTVDAVSKTITATGGAVVLDGGVLNGSVENTALTLTSGTVNASIAGGSIIGSDYALREVLQVSGNVEVRGSFNASLLQLVTKNATRIDVDGNSGASGFFKSDGYSVLVMNGGTLEVADGTKVKHGELELTLGSNGYATTGGSTDLSNYLLTGTDSVNVGAVLEDSPNATITMNGGTLNVDVATDALTATVGIINLNTDVVLGGSISGATINASKGTLSAALSGNNTLVGTGYALNSKLNNTGTLSLSGSFTIGSGLEVQHTAAGYESLNGGYDATNGFARMEWYAVDIADGVTADANATITYDGKTLKLGTDGVATRGGEVDYTMYYLNSGALSTKTIHDRVTGADITLRGGTLTVETQSTVTATGGAIKLVENGVLNGSLTNTNLTLTKGTLNAELKGGNTIIGAGYVLSEMIQNGGSLTVQGSFDASGLQLTTKDSSRVDVVSGNSGNSGFLKQGDSYVKIINGGTLTIDGAVVTHEDAAGALVLGTDGYARSAGGTNYGEYLLVGNDTVNVAAILGADSNATIKMQGGTLNVDVATDALTATAGIINLNTDVVLGGSISGATINASKGTLSAALSGNNTLVGTGYALNSKLNNTGTLSLSGSFTIGSGLEVQHTAAGYESLNGGYDATNGFARTEWYAVDIADGVTADANATITYDGKTLKLGIDGVATRGGEVDYTMYYLNSGELSTKTIHDRVTGADITLRGGTLTVETQSTVTATGGAIKLVENGVLNGSLTNTNLTLTKGTLNAELKGGNTIIGAGYVLSKMIQNGGSLTVQGSFDASGLQLTTKDSSRVDVVSGNSGNSGFLKQGDSYVQIINGGTLTIDGAVVTHEDAAGALVLGTDGYARSAGGTNYGEYLLVGNDTVNVAAILGADSNATIKMQGGTLNVDVATDALTATAGIINLNTDVVLGGSISGATINASKGTLSAALSGNNTLVGTGYALNSKLNNTGTLSLSGTFAVNSLTTNEAATYIGADGVSGFAKDAYKVATIATGTTTDAGATITYNGEELKLNTDGTASAGGTVHYDTFWLKSDVTVDSDTIHALGANALVDITAGTLTVKDETKVKATAGSIVLEGGVLNGSIENTALTLTSGTVNATISGGSVIGNSYALAEVLQVSGNVSISGSFVADKLALTTIDAKRVDVVEGNSGASGFLLSGGHRVQIINGGTLSIAAGTTVTHGSTDLTLGVDGYATSTGSIGSEYLLVGTDAVNVAAILEYDPNATINMQGGTLTVDAATNALTATAGTVRLDTDVTLGGSISGATVNASAGTLAAALSGNNTLVGKAYALSGVLNNSGTLTMSGTFTVNSLTTDEAATYVGLEGCSTSGFAKEAYKVATIATGATADAGVTITYNGEVLKLNTNGTASKGGTVDYSTFWLKSDVTVASNAIHTQSANALVNITAGKLMVKDETRVQANGGSVELVTGGVLNGSLSGTELTLKAGTVNASIADGSIIGSDYALSEVLQVSGNVSISGSFVADALTLTTIDTKRVDVVEGNSGNSGFLKHGDSYVQIISGDTLDIAAGTIVKHGSIDLTLGADGYARSAGGTEWGEYLLTGSDKVSTNMIHTGEGAGALVRQEGGLLTVNDATTVSTTSGTIILSGATLIGSVTDARVTAETGCIAATLHGITAVTVTDNVSMSGDNNHSGGTTLAGARLTITHANALGSGSISSAGQSSLIVGDDVTLVLGNSIDNSGELTLKGSIDASELNLELTEAGRLSLDGNQVSLSESGFARAAEYSVLLVAGGKTVNEGVSILHDDYRMRSELVLGEDGVARAGGGVDYSRFFLTGADAVSVSEVDAVSELKGSDLLNVTMDGGELEVDADITVEASGGNIVITDDSTLRGAIAHADITAAAGDYMSDISADVSGGSKVTVTGGEVTLSGANSYTGGTVISGGSLTAGSDTAFGTGEVELRGGVLELSRKPLENKLLAQGGIISGGSGFRGAVVVNGSVGLRGNLSARSMTINSGSVLTLNGSSVSVSGSLTLGGSAVLNLNGSDFGDGDVLITFGSLSGSEDLLTVTYGADSDKYGVEKKGNALILAWLKEPQPEEEEKPAPLPPTEPDIPEQPVPALDREGCDALVQSSWGVFTASHAFADAIGGQRSAAGYVGRQESVAWVSALGGMHRIDGTSVAAGSDIDLFGAAVGMEHYMSATDAVGIAVGRLSGDVRLKNSGRETEQSGTYFGLYGVHQLADFDRSNHLNLRWSTVYGDTETEGSIGQEKMSLRQDSVQLNARVDWSSQLSECWVINVFAGMEYFASESAENEESEEARVRMGSIQNLRGELGIGTRYTSGSTSLYGEVRYLNDMVRSNPYAEINGLRGYGANPGRQGIGVTLGAQQELGNGWSVHASYSLEAMSEATMHSANIGAALRF